MRTPPKWRTSAFSGREKKTTGQKPRSYTSFWSRDTTSTSETSRRTLASINSVKLATHPSATAERTAVHFCVKLAKTKRVRIVKREARTQSVTHASGTSTEARVSRIIWTRRREGVTVFAYSATNANESICGRKATSTSVAGDSVPCVKRCESLGTSVSFKCTSSHFSLRGASASDLMTKTTMKMVMMMIMTMRMMMVIKNLPDSLILSTRCALGLRKGSGQPH